MSEMKRIRGQFKFASIGPAWHGASLAENLQGISAEQAARHAIPGAHSIWEIVHHIAAWEHKAARVIAGEEYFTMQGDDDWPPVKETSANAWSAALAHLESGRTALLEAMKSFPESKLTENVPSRDFPWEVLLFGMTHHSLYHSGQIAILKKAVE